MPRLLWPSLWRILMAWRARQAIAALQALDQRMLKDIGIERSEIESVVRQFGRDPSRMRGTRSAAIQSFAANSRGETMP